jgi:TPR repeat protein
MAIELCREAVALLTPLDPDLEICLNNLANAVQMRFEQRGDPRDMNEAIDFYREALALCSPSHPTRYRSLSNLGNALQKRFEKSGDPADIEEAINWAEKPFFRPIFRIAICA